MNNAPFNYDYINTMKASYAPSEINIRNTNLFAYYQKYLLQKLISVFDWKLPETWARNYFLYTLYCWGFLGILETDDFGVIPQQCAIFGYNVFYQPTRITVANPSITGIVERTIDEDCVLLKLQPDYGSAIDIVNYFAEQMTLTSEAASVNIINSKLSYVFGAENKAAAESFKKLYDNIAAGEPATFIDKTLFREDGKPNWMMFSQNLKENYIAGDLLQDLQKWEYRFDTIVGIPNSNTEKRERLIVDEVNANNQEVRAVSEIWLEELKFGLEKARNMFGISEDELSVERREDPLPEMTEVTEDDKQK